MKEIRIDQLNEKSNLYFHFTRKESVENIMVNGITSLPPKRENMVARDKENPCIYFSYGFLGLLKTIDVWIRWEYDNIAREMKLPSGHITINKIALLKTYERVYKDFKNRIYFMLDLIEGPNPETSDFSFQETDYKKAMFMRSGNIPDFFKWYYGQYSNFESDIMEDWNMNTHIGEKQIKPDRITLLKDSKAESDALSIIKEIYNNYKDKIHLEYLEDFMNYVNEFEKTQYYYHHTKIEYLHSILENGLKLKNGEMSRIVNDPKVKVYFSEGMKGAIAMASAFYRRFNQVAQNPEYKNITLEQYLGKRVFLRFLSNGIENESDMKDFAFADGWTSKSIEPSKLKVCILRNIKTNDIYFDRDDIIRYMMSIVPVDSFDIEADFRQEGIKTYYKIKKEELENFNADDYILEDIDLDIFYELFIANRQNNISTLPTSYEYVYSHHI